MDTLTAGFEEYLEAIVLIIAEKQAMTPTGWLSMMLRAFGERRLRYFGVHSR